MPNGIRKDKNDKFIMAHKIPVIAKRPQADAAIQFPRRQPDYLYACKDNSDLSAIALKTQIIG